MSVKRLARTAVQVSIAALIAAATGARAQDWDDPAERKRAGRRREGDDEARAREARARKERARDARRPGVTSPPRQAGEQPAPMQLAGGKLYVVTGSTIRKLDAKTLEQEAEAVIPSGIDPEIETRMKELFMERFDADGDGFIREDEAPNPALVRKLDRDGDGAVGIDEARLPGGMAGRRGPAGGGGPVSLLVVPDKEGDGGDLYIHRDGWLYRYSTADLTLQAKNEIAPQMRPKGPLGRRERGDKRDRAGEKRGRKGRRDDERDVPPPPELPEEPARF